MRVHGLARARCKLCFASDLGTAFGATLEGPHVVGMLRRVRAVFAS